MYSRHFVIRMLPVLITSALISACSPRSTGNGIEPTRTLPPQTPRPSATPRPAATPTPVPETTTAPQVLSGVTRENFDKLTELYARREVLPRSIYSVGEDRVGIFSSGVFEAFDLKTLESLGDMRIDKSLIRGRYWYALSADAKIGAILLPEGKVQMYNIAAGAATNSFASGEPSFEIASDIALNRDGSEAAVVAQGVLQRHETKTGKPLGEPLSLAENVGFVSFARDASRLAAFRADGTVDMVDTRTLKIVTLKKQLASPSRVSFSQDGTQVSISNAETVWIFDTVSGEEIWTSDFSASVAFAPQGTVIAVYGGASIGLLDYDKRDLLREFTMSSGGTVRSAQFSEDGKTLFVEGGGLLESYSVDDGARIASVRRFAATQLSFTPDNRLVTWSDRFENGELAALNPADGKTAVSMLHSEPIRGAFVGAVGRYAASSTFNRSLFVWRLEDGKKMVAVEGEQPRGILCLTNSEDALAYFENGEVVVREIERNNTRKQFKAPFDELLGISTCENAKDYLAFHNASSIEIMSLAGRTVSNIELRKAVTDSLRLQMSGDGRYLAGVEDGTLWIWEAESGKVIQEIDLEPGEAALEFSPDGSQLLAVTRSKFELIKPADGKRITLDVPETHTMNVMFPPDGRIVVGASSVLDQDAPFVNGEPNFTSGALTVFDAETGKALRKVALENPIYTSAISPDGSRVAITGYDGGVSLWGLK